MELTLTVNGCRYTVDAPAGKSLADVLREDCRLTGTHVGCEQGVCGSCTVLLDGDPVRACLLLAAQCADAPITTIEGLANPGGPLHPVQEAFRRQAAFQCGFCTPGFVMLLAGALRGEPVDETALRVLVSANLCRCTGYLPILAAARDAAAELAQTSGEESLP